nr:uncharacterized protein LOC102094299 isoform X3 [Columba livia]
MEQQMQLCTSPEQGGLVTSEEPNSFSSRFLCWILQLGFVKYLLKILHKASAWIGLMVSTGTRISKFYPTQSPTRPGNLVKRHQGRGMSLLLSVLPIRIKSTLGYGPAVWDQSNMAKEILESPTNPSNKANKRKRDDVPLEEQESQLVILQRDLLDDDSEDLTYEPSDVETDSEEYNSQNDTDLDLEEQDGNAGLEHEEQDRTVLLKESPDLQSCSLTVPLSLHVENIQPIGVSDAPEVLAASTELGPEDSAGSSSEEDAPDVDSGDAQKPEDDKQEP